MHQPSMQSRTARLRTWAAAGVVVAVAVAASACGSGSSAPQARAGGRRAHRHLSRPGRHPQDQARDRDPAGEPLVRLLLRHLPGRRRHPDEQRPAHGVRARPVHRHLRSALRRPCRRERRRSPLGPQRHRRHQRRQDGRVHRPGRVRPEGLPRPDRPGLHQLGHPGRHGVPHGERHPQLLDLRQGLRPPGPHVRAQCVVEPAVPPLPGLRVVGLLHAGGQSVQLRQRPPDQAGRAPAERPGRLRRRGRAEERHQDHQARHRQEHRERPSPSTPGPT